MAGVNDLIVLPTSLSLHGPLELDPATVLSPPAATPPAPIKTMTVANGGVVKVYDVTDPANPVLLQTIG